MQPHHYIYSHPTQPGGKEAGFSLSVVMLLLGVDWLLRHTGFLKQAAADPALPELYRDDDAVVFDVLP